MATLNEMIAQGAQFNIPDPTAQYNKLAQMQKYQQENELAKMQMEEYGRARQESNALRQFLPGLNESNRSQLLRYGAAGQGVYKTLAEGDRERRLAEQAVAATAKSRSDILINEVGRVRDLVSGLKPTDQVRYTALRNQTVATHPELASVMPEFFDADVQAYLVSTAASVLERARLATTARGQDITAGTAVRGQDITARGQDIGASTAAAGQGVTVRGQDLTAGTATRGQDISATTATRGQDIGAATAAAGQGVTVRGQDIGAATTTRGQDIGAATAAAGQGVTVRGQDIGAATAAAGQGVTARGQDIGASTAIRGQDIGAATAAAGQGVTARGQDIAAKTAAAGQGVTMRGQDLVNARENENLKIRQEDQRRAADPAFQQSLSQARALGVNIAKDIVVRTAALPKVIDTAEMTLNEIDALIGKRDGDGNLLRGQNPHPGFQDAVGATYLPGLRFVPGTQAANFQARFDQIKGGAFLQAFETLKGGGSITNIEGEKGTSALNRMQLAQSEKEFITAAREFQGIIKTGVERAKKLAASNQTAAPDPLGIR